MLKHNSSYSKIEKIEKFSSSEDLIDISVDSEDRLFSISETGDSWMLTHNSESPDIDNDVSDRDKLITLMKEKFGNDCVIPITNWNLMQLKSLVKDLSKLYGIDFNEVNAVTGNLDAEVRHKAMAHGENKSLFFLTFEDCMKYSEAFRTFIENHPEIGKHIKDLYRNVKSCGKHAGGVIVMDNLEELMPLISSKGELQTPWSEGMNVKHIESTIGTPKIDILGLETLRMIQRTIELILENQNKKIQVISDENKIVEFGYMQNVLLTSGKYKLAKDLTEEDEIDDIFLQNM